MDKISYLKYHSVRFYYSYSLEGAPQVTRIESHDYSNAVFLHCMMEEEKREEKREKKREEKERKRERERERERWRSIRRRGVTEREKREERERRES